MNKIEALRAFFEADSHDPDFPARKITMDEIKALSMPEREELAKAAAAALGVTLDK